MKFEQLAKKSGLYLIGSVSSKLLSFILLPIFAYYITSEQLGYYDYISTLISIALPVLFFAIWEAVLKFVLSSKNKEESEVILNTSTIFVLLIIALLFLIVLSSVIFDFFDTPYKWYIFGMFSSNGLSIIWQYNSRALGKNKLFVVSSIVSTIINIVTVLILVVFAKLGLVGLFWSFILGQLSCFLFLELNLRMIKNLSFNKFNLNILKKMLKFSSPLILNLISNWLIFSFGRILLLQYFGENINGLYSFANRLTVVITLLGSVVTMSLIEESIMMAKEHSISKESSYIINVLIVAFLTFSIMFIPASKLFFLVVRNTEYYVAHKYMPLLILFSLLSVISTIIGSIFQAISKTQVQFFSTLIGALFSVAFSFLLLNWLDEYGIIWGQIIGSGVMIVIRYIMAYKYIKIKLNFYVYVLLIALFSATSFIAIKYNFIENIILLVCATIVFFILNRKIIIDLFGMLKKLIKKPQTDPK